MSRTAVTLRSPGGATVRCAAQKRFALAVAVPPKDGKPALKVVFRTDNAETAVERGRREAKTRSRPVMLFLLREPRLLGSFAPLGRFDKIGPTS